jgi:uncharacterized protein DUF899
VLDVRATRPGTHPQAAHGEVGLLLCNWLENATNKEENTMNLPQVVSREEWLAARKELLVKEKDLTRYGDEVNADRRQLPMVRRSSRTSEY